MTVMIMYVQRKEHSLVEEVRAQADRQNEIDGTFEEIYTAENEKERLCMKLPEGYGKSEIKYSYDFMNHSVQMCFSGLPKDYFKTHRISGSVENISDMYYYDDEDLTYLYLITDGIYECESNITGGKLYISWKKPTELYDKIVVLDAGHGGEDVGAQGIDTLEKEIVLDVTMKVKKMLEDDKIKVYCTRIDDENISLDQRIVFANEMFADMFLSIHCTAEEADASKHGMKTYYNETYFIPEFGNADLAYEVEKNTTKYASANALGVEAGETSNYLIKHIQIPAAYLDIGYLSNEQENNLLKREEYRDKIAKGIYEAILSSYEMIKE